jgi:hypothetical protein
MAGLHPQSYRHFARQPSGLLSQILRTTPLRHMNAAGDEYWHLYRSGCRHLRALLTCDVSISSINLPAPEAGDFGE